MVSAHTTKQRIFTQEDVNFLQAVANVLGSAIQRQAVEQAVRQAGQRKDEFLALLGHELRNPLTPIRSAVDLMKMEPTQDARLTRMSGIIDRQVGHLTRLVDDLLDVSRITHGKVTLRKETVELASAVRNATEAVQSLIQTRKHALSVTLPDEPVYLNADPVRLIQVIDNLLSNAAKYTPEGGHIRLVAEATSKQVTLHLIDNGIGMPSDLVPHIFEVFVRGEQDLARSIGGLGLGLTLVHGLVEMHGGTMEARSAGVGKGSEFIVRLPRLIPQSRGHEQALDDAQGVANKKNARVLIVDDNVDIAMAFPMMLETVGEEVRVVHRGQAALDVAPEFLPHVVLLDIGLPGMDGFEVACRMRQVPGLQATKLVTITGYGQEQDRFRSKEAGFDNHLVKPVNMQAILGVLPAD
ncbi:MAG: hybrid sensor histidine kinase/response regulator [Dehalococcoidia bacterium]|nr:hybrid sensor histidine kinase/response regulator [Dehalococcoidia bacterium]